MTHGDSNRLLEDLVSKNHIDIVNQKLKHLLEVNFRVLMCAIRICFNKIILQMTNDEVNKFTSSIFIEEAAVNDIKKPGF